MSALASLSATAAHTWLNCGRRATHKYIHGHREELDYDPVAIRFGNLVHESITGEENDFSKPVEYDQHTQNHHQLGWQTTRARDLLNIALEKIADDYPAWYWETKYETQATMGDTTIRVVGIADAIAVVDSAEGAALANIIDLKTGARELPHHYFSQLAMYCWLVAKCKPKTDEYAFTPHRATLVHVNRRLLDRGMEAVTVKSLPAEPLIGMGEDIIAQTINAMNRPVANPGQHCEQCENTGCVYHPQF
ncbi:MAG: PD-(D/E)XK nuclease family protein [Rhodobacteraceae bacterium]|nr:PD-(D/E)XK nuclease family protein [Paracoccaceae bacterium]